MHECPSYKRGGIICIFLKSGKETIPTYRCKFPPLFKGSMKALPPSSHPSPMPPDLHMFRFKIKFALCFKMAPYLGGGGFTLYI